MLTIEDIARTCHEANRALCVAYGDHSQVAWEQAPDDIKASAIDGVRHLWEHSDATPQSLHDNWSAYKRAEGWVWGPIKDATRKQHPCLVPYGDLPREQQVKDYAFGAIARALFPLLDQAAAV